MIANPASALVLRRHALSCLGHPLSLLAIATLVVNDHLLKVLWPSVLTGKLSDLAGLFFFPFLVAFVLTFLPARLLGQRGEAAGVKARAGVLERRLGRLAFFLTATWFAGMQLLPSVDAATEVLVGLVTGRDGIIVRDSTDLIALLVLWPVWRIWRKPSVWRSGPRSVFSRGTSERPSTQSRRSQTGQPWLESAALALAALATLATSYPPPTEVRRLAQVGDRVCTTSVEIDGLWSPACSSDGGRTWHGAAPEIEDQVLLQGSPDDDLGCVRPDVLICYRIAGAERIERSTDGGLSWELDYALPEGRIGFRDRVLSPPLWYFLTYDVFLPGPHDLLVLDDERSHRVMASAGTEGVLVREDDGQWRAYAVGEAIPTPIRAELPEDLSLLHRTLIPEITIAGFVAGLAALLSLFGGWKHARDGWDRRTAAEGWTAPARKALPAWSLSLPFVAGGLVLVLSNWPLVALGLFLVFGSWWGIPVGLVLLGFGYWLLRAVKRGLRSDLAFISEQAGRPDGGRRWLLAGTGFGLLGFLAFYLPAAAWALGIIASRSDTIFPQVLFSAGVLGAAYRYRANR